MIYVALSIDNITDLDNCLAGNNIGYGFVVTNLGNGLVLPI